MNKKRFFITGTDTGVGKTKISCTLLQAANKLDLSTCGLKPIASGCELIDGLWRNEDAIALQQAGSFPLDYEDINPFAFAEAIAPHIAAEKNNASLSVQPLLNRCRWIINLPIDFTIVEGAGGWLVPLNQNETLADFVCAMKLPVVLVVGIRLGCINHALLTVQSIKTMGLTLSAWVANGIDPNTENEPEIIDSLCSRINAPCLGRVPFVSDLAVDENLSRYLDISPLLN